tara:strand:+ start:2807 stop:3088 length:282 start_codon:yes stop_codon:yes gene_type:complete
MKYEKFIDLLLTVSVIITIILVLWFIIGNSPTIDQILVAFLTGLFLYLLNKNSTLNHKIDKNTKLMYRTREYMIEEFSEIRLDLAEIKHKINH